MLTEYVRHWIADPDGGGMFTGQRNLIQAHDTQCPSLKDAWLPRRKGVTALGDTMGCDVCDITFFWEGLVALFDDCPDSHWYFCRCCAEKVADCPCSAGCAKDGQTLSPAVDR